VDGVKLIDYHQWRVFVGLDQIALVDEETPCAAVKRRTNEAVLEVELRLQNLGRVSTDRRVVGVSFCDSLVVLLAGSYPLLKQVGVALGLDAGIFRARLIASQIGFRLLQRHLERWAIDLKQQVALVHILPSRKCTAVSSPETKALMATVE